MIRLNPSAWRSTIRSAAIAALLVAVPRLMAATPSTPRQFEIVQQVTATPSNNNPLSKLIIILPMPVASPHQRLVGEAQCQVVPLMQSPARATERNTHFELVEAAPYGHRVLKVALVLPKPQPRWTVRLSYRVELTNLAFDLPTLRSVRWAQLAAPADELRIWLKPETLVESDSAEVRDALLEIFPHGISPEMPVYDVAWKIYAFVLDRCSYQLNSERGRARQLWGARDMLATTRGECGDYAALFVALCRAAGLPARPQVGFWADKTNEPHVWAEFHVPGHGWVPADPSVGDGTPLARYREFANLPNLNRRLVVADCFDHFVGDLKSTMLQAYSYWYYYRGEAVRITTAFSQETRELSAPPKSGD